jgi:hypothetical protein
VVRQDTVAIAGGGVRIDIDARTDPAVLEYEPDNRRIIVASNWLSEVIGRAAAWVRVGAI